MRFDGTGPGTDLSRDCLVKVDYANSFVKDSGVLFAERERTVTVLDDAHSSMKARGAQDPRAGGQGGRRAGQLC
jgi:hypothetical protein